MIRVEFGADGIRGMAGEGPFHPAIAVLIGQALGRFVCSRTGDHCFVVIGRDTRPSGAILGNCLAAGLTAQGADVVDLGVMTTPGVAYLVRRLQADLGLIVSASHNPLEFNGIKLVGPDGLRFQREEEIEIESLIDEFLNRPVGIGSTLGQYTDGQNLIELYIQSHVKRCPAGSLEDLKIVLDCAHGAASRVAPEVFRRLGAQIVVINDQVERNAINHQAGSEFARSQPHQFAEILDSYDATYGFAFDGDGDRLVVVDRQGQLYDGHDILYVLARHFQSQGLLRGNAVVTIHQANRGLEEALNQVGIKTIYTPNGDRYLEAAMWGEDYLLGGEPGGNFILNDGHHTAADAVYAALVLGGVLVARRDVSLSEMAAPLQKRPQKSTSVPLSTPLTLEQRSSLQTHIKDMQEKLGQDGRILVWDSSTEPGVFRVLVEGGRQSTLEEVSNITETICRIIRCVANSSA